MRFKSSIKNAKTFIKLSASLNLLGKVAWVRLDNHQVRLTVVPERGSQVWAVLSINAIFDDDYHCQSASDNNAINLEVPLGPLTSALKSAQNASSASIRLTKKDGIPLLALTVVTPLITTSSGRTAGNLGISASNDYPPGTSQSNGYGFNSSRETTITQEVAIRVLASTAVESLHEPRCSEPEVHILFPPLFQLKAVSERFIKLALSSNKSTSNSGLQSGRSGPRLELSANMHGELKVGIKTDALEVESKWTGLSNPELDPQQVEGGEEGVRRHPSTRKKEAQGREAWAVVRVDGKDWARVLGVGRLGGKVVACFIDEQALILYVYLPTGDDEENSVLTYYIGSYTQ